MKFIFMNEAMYCLQEGILRDPEAGDLGAIMGIGFPPFTGGPFAHIDSIGTERVVFDMDDYAAKHGSRYAPAPLLRKLGATNTGVYEFWSSKEQESVEEQPELPEPTQKETPEEVLSSDNIVETLSETPVENSDHAGDSEDDWAPSPEDNFSEGNSTVEDDQVEED